MTIKSIILYTLLFTAFGGNAEEYTSSLQKYNTDNYIKSFVQKESVHKKDISSHLEELKKNAVQGIASQIEMRIQQNAELKKEAINGHSTIAYKNTSQFKTDVKLELVETDYVYDKKKKTLIVVAFIDKNKACNYYKKENYRLNIEMDGFINNVTDLINKGEISKAKLALESDMPNVTQVDNWEQRLSIFGCARQELMEISTRNNNQRQRVNELETLILSSELIYLKYPSAYNEGDQLIMSGVKANLANKGLRFTTNEDRALWYITINSKSRNQNEVYGIFFSYVDVEVNLVNQKNAQQIYQEVLTQKGGDTSYEKATRKAYTEVGKKIGENLYVHISK